MAQPSEVMPPEDEESLKTIFESAMKLYESIENGKEATNSDAVQMNIRTAINKLEKATNLVSLAGLFSRNESVDELPTDTLQYLLLPVLLGTLNLKLIGRPRTDIIHVAEIYFRDFLQRCKDYGITDIEVPQVDSSPNCEKPQSEQAKIASMVLTREAKIKRYKDAKALKDKLTMLSKAMASSADDETKRNYFTTLLETYINNALDELCSIDQEKPILEYMAQHGGEKRPKERENVKPLRPVIITRDALQKAVFGAGYPAIPAMTVEEFYDQRVKEGIFPGSCSTVPHTILQTSDDVTTEDSDDAKKDNLAEVDDPEELARQRNMDEYKDDHRRGWGNRHNRS